MDLNSVSVNISNDNEVNLRDAENKNSKSQVTNYDTNAPPSYNGTTDAFLPASSTLFKSISYARQTTSRSYKMLSNLAKCFCCSITIIIIVAVLMALPIIMVTIGSYYLKNCTIQKMIPIWLIVLGVLMMIKNISTLVHRINSIKKREDTSSSTALNVFDSFMSIFIVIWFICGNIWVYSIYDRVQHINPADLNSYCSKNTYLFSFWFITSIYIVMGFACIMFCFTVCLTICITTEDWYEFFYLKKRLKISREFQTDSKYKKR